MRLILELAFFFFAYLIVYRRLIEPFMEGFRSRSKTYNSVAGNHVKSKSATRHPEEIEEDTKQIIIDAEYTEL